MERLIGTMSMGIRAPIIRDGDDLVKIVTESILNASKRHKIAIEDNDIIAITESIVARAEGNYVTVDQVAADVKRKFGEDLELVVLFPILSRNRFAMCLKGIARATKKMTLVLQYPSDEVGNKLISDEDFEESGFHDNSMVLDERLYRQNFGFKKHEFTGVDYVTYYRDLVEAENCEIRIVFANSLCDVIRLGKNFLCADIHTRKATKKYIEKHGTDKKVLTLDEICNEPIEGSGFNPTYGLLGSNKANEERLKLFPRGGQELVEKVQKTIFGLTGKQVHVMVYGDGAFKDPVGKIWELADPVVSPAHTKGLLGQPNELKLKALADGKYEKLSGEALKEAISEEIRKKGDNLVGNMLSQGTTPRRITDLVGSLCDLTSGSGDKGTPIVWVKGYFDNYTK